MALSTSMMSSNIGGVSLANALNFSVSLGREDLKVLGFETYFDAGPCRGDCYLMVNLGAILDIIAVLVVGIDPSGLNNHLGWHLTFGNSADPTSNPTMFTAG